VLDDVLGELLEITATCIADLVNEIREVLEDHGHNPGATPVRFGTAADLIAFLDHGIRPLGPGSSRPCPTPR
jgi:hypothetical protein